MAARCRSRTDADVAAASAAALALAASASAICSFIMAAAAFSFLRCSCRAAVFFSCGEQWHNRASVHVPKHIYTTVADVRSELSSVCVFSQAATVACLVHRAQNRHDAASVQATTPHCSMHASGKKHRIQPKAARNTVRTLMEKNMGPSSASHSGSTAVTHCMYSLLVNTSSWYVM